MRTVVLESITAEVDANKLGLNILKTIPKETLPAGVVFDGYTCVDCDLEIEPERLAVVSTYRCGECKMWHDKDLAKAAAKSNLRFEDDE